MNLSHKIQDCRKRAGLSQEALAAQLGVSRQAISKWELGEAEPELKNLQLLAKAFGVSTDYLLSDEEVPKPAQPAPQLNNPQNSFLDQLPKFLSGLFRRFGWLAGVYIAGVGGFISLACGILYGFSTAAIKTMDKTQDQFLQQFPGLNDPFFGSAAQASNNEAFQFFNGILLFLTIIGLLVVLAGILLAVKLKKTSKET